MNTVSIVFILLFLNVFIMVQRITAIFNIIINCQQEKEKEKKTLADSAFKD